MCSRSRLKKSFELGSSIVSTTTAELEMNASSSSDCEDDQSYQKITIDALEDLDFDLIGDMPWAQKLWKEVESHTKKGFLHWCQVVKSVAGTKDEHIQQWSKLYSQTIDDLLCELMLDVVRMRKSTVDKLKELLKQLQGICDDLHEPIPQKIGENELSLYKEQEQLMIHIQKYEAILNAKKDELKTLQEKQRKLCKRLGQEPTFSLHYPPLPTPKQLEELHKHIDEMEAVTFEREEQYCLLKHEIMEYAKEIKYKPSSDFERKVLESDNFLVTKENMKMLEFFAKCLKETKKSMEEEVSQLRGRIEDLWKMLDINLMDRDDFRSHYTGNSIDTLDALRIEVRRCEEIRNANIKNFVEKLRAELESMWIKCHCTDIEKRSFKYFFSDCYTEDLLDIHELEIQKWKQYYDENEKLLKLLEKHQELWEKVAVLEENATGPNRYQNRGGKLLQEEKERNKLSKIIPKIEEEIITLADDYANKNNGLLFTSFGRLPQEYIELKYAERENNRKLKLSARKVQRDNTLAHTPGKSALCIFPSTSKVAVTPIPSATKRKILATPDIGNNMKRPRVNTPKRIPAAKQKVTPQTVPKIKVTHPTLPLPNQKRRSMDKTGRRKSGRLSSSKRAAKCREPAVNESDDTKNTTYSEFQNELSSQEQWRSTLMPDNIPQRIPAASVLTPRPTRGRIQLRSPATPNMKSPKLSACKSNLKLLF